jgi:hypothetical protein
VNSKWLALHTDPPGRALSPRTQRALSLVSTATACEFAWCAGTPSAQNTDDSGRKLLEVQALHMMPESTRLQHHAFSGILRPEPLFAHSNTLGTAIVHLHTALHVLETVLLLFGALASPGMMPPRLARRSMNRMHLTKQHQLLLPANTSGAGKWNRQTRYS